MGKSTTAKSEIRDNGCSGNVTFKTDIDLVVVPGSPTPHLSSAGHFDSIAAKELNEHALDELLVFQRVHVSPGLEKRPRSSRRPRRLLLSWAVSSYVGRSTLARRRNEVSVGVPLSAFPATVFGAGAGWPPFWFSPAGASCAWAFVFPMNTGFCVANQPMHSRDRRTRAICHVGAL
jgi:hypothetical protein